MKRTERGNGEGEGDDGDGDEAGDAEDQEGNGKRWPEIEILQRRLSRASHWPALPSVADDWTPGSPPSAPGPIIRRIYRKCA